MAIPLTLRVVRDGQPVATKEFERDIIKIGRLSSAHLCIEDERVSRIHAVIEVAESGTVSIVDMGSVEGTFVNGKRVSKVALATGDAITLGETRIEVSIGVRAEAEAEAPAPVAEPAPAPAVAAVSTPAGVSPEVLAAAQQAAAQVIAAAQAAAAQAALAQTPATPMPAVQAPVEAAVANVAVPAQANVAVQVPASIAPAPGSFAELYAQRTPPGRIVLLQGAVPKRPVPLPRGATDRSLQLDVRISWGDQQLAVGHFDVQSKVTVGTAAGVDFEVAAAHVQGDSFALLERVDGNWALSFTAAMDGEFVTASGAQRLADLVKSGKARKGDDGVYQLPIAGHEAAWVELGNGIRADVCFRPTPKAAVVPLSQRLDYPFLNVFVIAAFLVLGTVVAATNGAHGADVVQDDLHSNDARWAKTLFQAPKRQYNPFFDKLALKAPKDPGATAAKAAGEEGKMGKRDAPVRNTRSAPRAIDPKDKEQVKNQGILAMLGKGQNAGLSTIFGTGGLGGDLKGAIGGITGNSVGDAHGFGGLGLKGTGTGGGGSGNTIGVGAVGTKGRGGGMGSFGNGVGGLGKKGSSDVQISSSEAVIVGYDKELVRRVVHSHHAQLRYCYESELVRNPAMSGKVTVKWVIGSQGAVTQVSTQGSTLNNARVESCLNARVKSWNFPPPKGGGIAVITYPFVFRPSGG